jgi:hypothetical protein
MRRGDGARNGFGPVALQYAPPSALPRAPPAEGPTATSAGQARARWQPAHTPYSSCRWLDSAKP